MQQKLRLKIAENVFSMLVVSMFLSLVCSWAPVAASLRFLLAATRLELLVCHSSVDRLGSLVCCNSTGRSFLFPFGRWSGSLFDILGVVAVYLRWHEQYLLLRHAFRKAISFELRARCPIFHPLACMMSLIKKLDGWVAMYKIHMILLSYRE